MTHMSMSPDYSPLREIYKGEIKADKDQTKPYFVQYLRPLLGQLMQFQLSLSNEMTDQLLPESIRRQGCSIALHNSWLINFALSFIHLLAPPADNQMAMTSYKADVCLSLV